MDRLRDTQDAFKEATVRLSEVETDNAVLMRQLQALLPKDEVRYTYVRTDSTCEYSDSQLAPE